MNTFDAVMELLVAVQMCRKAIGKLKPGQEYDVELSAPYLYVKAGSVGVDVVRITVRRPDGKPTP